MEETHILELLSSVVKESINRAKEIIIKTKQTNFIEEKVIKSSSSNNILYHSDNVTAIIDLLNKGYENTIDLIYIDPPFLTMVDYKSRIELWNKDEKQVISYFAYNDIWKDGLKEYLEMLTIRLYLMRELLSDMGTIYVHLDYRAVHYVKIIMDYIFRDGCFLNEVIWAYKSGGSSNKYFSRKHDNILVFTKTKDYIFNPQKEKSYNRGLKPYGFKNVKEYRDNIGWHTLVNLKDVWNIDMVGRTSKERVSYATQKPESLLELIINSSSNEGSIVADFFGGSGTTAVVAQKNNRKWILADKGNISEVTIRKRLAENGDKSYNILRDKAYDIKKELKVKSKLVLNKNKTNSSLVIELEKYNVDIKTLKMSKKHKDIVKEILVKDSISFIDYLSLTYIPAEDVEITLKELYRLPNKLRIDHRIEFIIDNKYINENLYLKIIDVFGNKIYKSLIL